MIKGLYVASAELEVLEEGRGIKKPAERAGAAEVDAAIGVDNR